MNSKIKNYIQNQIKELLESKYGYYKDKDGKIVKGSFEDAWGEKMKDKKKKPSRDKVNDPGTQLGLDFDINEEKAKGLDGKECWDGYKLQGTKKKNGKTVDNCVPMKESSLTGEYEGKPTSISGEELKYILNSNLEISNSLEDFINKVTYQITDETSILSAASIDLLKNYYNQHSINEEEGSVETDDSDEAEKLAKKGVNVKLTKEDLLRQKIQEVFKKKLIHETNIKNISHKLKGSLLNEDDSFIPNHYDTTHIPKEIEAVLTQLGLTPLDRYIDYVNFMNTLPKSVKIVLTNGNDFDLYMEEFGLVLKADQVVDLSDDRNLPLAKKVINQLLSGPIQVDDMEGEEIEDDEDISIEEPETEEEPTVEPEA
jgi:hypothetical protein